MANKNYIKGRRKEWALKRELELHGWIVLRTAGSHGFADLVAIDKLTRVIKFIQCKPDDFSESQKKKLEEENSYINNAFRCEFEVI